MKKYFAGIFFIIIQTYGNIAYSQNTPALYIANAKISVEPGSLLFADGNVQYDGNILKSIDLNGILQIKGNWLNSSPTDNRVFSDISSGIIWFNDSIKKTQTIGGTNTRFPNLLFNGNTKQLTGNIEISNLLDLRECELVVNGNSVTILSTNADAIDFSQGGYINTSDGANPHTGWLIRNMLKGITYIFPLGSHGISTYRFRPLLIQSQNDGNIFGQFQHYSPAKDAYPPSSMDNNALSSINELYFYSLTTDVAADAIVNIQTPYNSDDGNFVTMANWDNLTGEWKKLQSLSSADNTFNTTNRMFTTTTDIVLNNKNMFMVNFGLETEEAFIIPNVITPNGDGINDMWIIDKNKFPVNTQLDVTIFNRWNSIVYQSNNYDNKWEGRGLDEGTYFYLLKAILPDGTVKEYKGFIALHR